MNKFSIIAALSSLMLVGQLVAQELYLRKGDVIQLNIGGIPENDQAQISRSYPINDLGHIRMPYISEIKAAGLKPDQLAKRIESKYKSSQIFTRPRVTVTTPEENTIQRRVTVSGEVNGPGVQTYQNNMTILEAIASAGGRTPYSNMKKIRVIRGSETFYVNLTNIAKYPENDILLEPGDKIIVPD